MTSLWQPTVRERLDPGGTLPKVRIDEHNRVSWPDFGTRHQWRLFLPDSEWPQIGHTDVLVESDKGHFDGIEIEQQYRGRGLGLAIYLAAIELVHDKYNLPFVTQELTQSPDAKRIWEHMAEVGVARMIEPFTLSAFHMNYGIEKYKGKYVIPIYPHA